MNGSQITPIILLSATGFAALIAILLIVFGRRGGTRVSRHADWVALGGWLPLGLASIIGFVQQMGAEAMPLAWKRGWILSHTALDGAKIGTFFDLQGLWLLLMGALLSLFALFYRPEPGQARGHEREAAPERILASILIGFTGLSVGAVALTPWMSLVAVALAGLAGFFALGPRWELDEEAQGAIRFVSERAWGWGLSFLGACVLGSTGADLTAGGAPWESSIAAQLGGALLASGLFFQLHPFPFSRVAVLPSRSPVLVRVLCTLILPGWIAFFTLVRFEPQLRAVGVLPILGYVALASAGLCALAGFFQTRWNLGLNAWLAISQSLAVAALAAAGPAAGLAILVGAGLGAFILASAGSSLSATGESATPEKSAQAIWLKAACFLAAFIGMGGPGFLASGAYLKWLAQDAADPTLLAVSGLGLFLSGWLGWRVAWMAVIQSTTARISWGYALSPYALALTALAVFSTGALSGGAIPGASDLVLESKLMEFFTFARDAAEISQEFISASILHWALFTLAIPVAWWATAREKDVFFSLRTSLPRLSRFVESGYGIDAGAGRVVWLLQSIGSFLQKWIDHRVWGQWIPGLLDTGVRGIARATALVDRSIWLKMESTLSQSINSPAKLLQLIQSGNLQWYLFFAVGSGIAMLLHFWKF